MNRLDRRKFFTRVEEISVAMLEFLAKTSPGPPNCIQPIMDPSVQPPDKNTSFASPTMIFVIVGIIVAAFVMFLVLHPS
jgi:hypothetical protein